MDTLKETLHDHFQALARAKHPIVLSATSAADQKLILEFFGKEVEKSVSQNLAQAYYNHAIQHGSVESGFFISFVVHRGGNDDVRAAVPVSNLLSYVISTFFENPNERSKITSYDQFPLFMLPIVELADNVHKRFPLLPQPAGDSKLANPIYHIIRNRLASACFDYTQKTISREIVFYSLLILFADVLFMSESEREKSKELTQFCSAFRVQLLMHKNKLIDVLCRLSNGEKIENVNEGVLDGICDFCMGYPLASKSNRVIVKNGLMGFSLFPDPEPRLIVTRACTLNAVTKTTQKSANMDTLAKLADFVSFGQETEKVDEKISNLITSIPVTESGAKRARTETVKNEDAFDKHYALLLKETPSDTGIPAPEDEKETEPLFDPITFRRHVLVPVEKKSFDQHRVLSMLINLHYHSSVEQNSGQVCLLHPFMAKAFISSLWKAVLGYVAYVFTSDRRKAHAVADLPGDEKFMSTLYLDIITSLSKFDVEISSRLDDVMKLMLMLVPGMHVRLGNPANSPNPQKVIADVQLMMKLATESASQGIMGRLCSPTGIDASNEITKVVSLMILSVTKKGAVNATVFYDLIGHMEISTQSFDDESHILLSKPVFKRRQEGIELACLASYPVPRVNNFKPSPDLWENHPFEMEPVFGATIPNAKSLAVVLSCIEFSTFYPSDIFAEKWKKYMKSKASPHMHVLDTLGRDCLYPLFLSFNHAKIMQEGVEEDYRVFSTCLIFHNECYTEMKNLNHIPGVSQSLVQYLQDIPSLPIQTVMKGITTETLLHKYI